MRFQIANGANLLPGNEVRDGGAIGLVDDMKPVRLPDGTVAAPTPTSPAPSAPP